jgi:hypothetical protein
LRTVLVTAKVLHRFAGAWPFAFLKHNRAILFSASMSARFSSLPPGVNPRFFPYPPAPSRLGLPTI